jgi:transcriptional regulator with XRE-family HTH domain
MATIYEKLGENVKRFRNKAGLSQEALATKAQLDLTSVSEIESGLRNPSLKTIYKLAKALDVNAGQLLPF